MILLINIETLINSDVVTVWEAIINRTHLNNWLCEDSLIVPEKGGKFELFWDKNNPKINSTLGCKILDLDAQKMILVEWKGPVEFESIMNNPPSTTVRITIQSIGAQVLLSLQHYGWKRGELWKSAFLWHNRVWENALISLKEYCENLSREKV